MLKFSKTKEKYNSSFVQNGNMINFAIQSVWGLGQISTGLVKSSLVFVLVEGGELPPSNL